jgi:hypothetical protein
LYRYVVGGSAAASAAARALVRTTREALELGLKGCRPHGGALQLELCC